MKNFLLPVSISVTLSNVLTAVTLVLTAFTTNSFTFRAPLPRTKLSRTLYAKPFWENGLRFGCTGCGKCCKNEGEVFFNIDEFSELVSRLKLPVDRILDQYCDEVTNGWVKMKSVVSSVGDSFSAPDEQCIFLGSDGRTCSVYESRPVQCRTFPYWPHILKSKAAWEDAGPNTKKEGAVVSSEGCEGIDLLDALLVDPTVIHRNSQLYSTYLSAFPDRAPVNEHTQAEERARLRAKLSVIEDVAARTRLWVRDFVLKHALCPFAVSVFHKEQVRYRVCFETDRSKIIDRVKYEALDLLQRDESEIATTLLMLPNAFPNFMDFHEFSLDMEDLVMPAFEEHTLAFSRSRASQPQPPSHTSALLPEIQLAFFHPRFSWAPSPYSDDNRDISDSDGADGKSESTNKCPHASTQPGPSATALDFEKRAPFPTINLLRAKTVRMYANEDVTKKISQNNEKNLRSAGAATLSAQFQEFTI